MPMVTMPGLSSGIETDEIVEKLKKVEEQPIYRYNEQIEMINLENAALEQLRVRAAALEKALKPLYNYDAPFERKVLEPSEPGFVEGIARKDAETGEYEIEIENLATALSFHSRLIENEEQLSPTLIEIDGESAHFEGGSADDLKDFLNKNFEDKIKAKTIRKSSKGKILVIESLEQGIKGIPEITDSVDLFYSIELVWDHPFPPAQAAAPPVTPGQPQMQKRSETERVSFDPNYMSTISEGPAQVSADGRTLELKERAARRFDIVATPGPAPAEGTKTVKAIAFTVVAPASGQNGPVDTGPFSIQQGPVKTLNVKGIVLNSYNITRQRPAPEMVKEPGTFGVEIPGLGRKDLTSQAGRVQIPVSQVPAYVDFYTQDRDINFQDMEVVYEVETPAPPSEQQTVQQSEGGSEAEEMPEHIRKQKERFPHIINPAQNAMLKLDGVEVEREKNEKIDDLIEGAIIDLKKPTDGPIEVAVAADIEASLERINDFITAYNALLEYSKMASEGAAIDKTGEYDRILEESGPLVTDSTVRTLVAGLRRRVHDPYPSVREPHLKILSSLGISTGEIGSSWEEISEGYLQLNEDLFIEILMENPRAVRDFFGLDSNGDSRIDNGMAYVTTEYLKPYAQPLKGIITARITSNEERIDDLNEAIEKKKEHVERYEQQLRDKFGYMESVIQQQKSTEKFIQQRFKTESNK